LGGLKRFYKFVSIISLVILLASSITLITNLNDAFAVPDEGSNANNGSNGKNNSSSNSNSTSTDPLVVGGNSTSTDPLVVGGNSTSTDPLVVGGNSTSTDPLVVGGNSTSTDQNQKKSCDSLQKENNGKSDGKGNALENNDCVLENEDFVDDEANSKSKKLDKSLVDDEANSKSKKLDKSLVKGKQNKVTIIKYGGITAAVRPLYTTADDPANHIVGPGGLLDGVGKLSLIRDNGKTIGCSGSLLPTGEHVLTAAHCVTDDDGIFNLSSGTVTFFGNSVQVIDIDVSQISVPKRWDGDFMRGNDIAVIKLVDAAPNDITRYDIDKKRGDDIGAIGEKVGFGMSGTGDTGATFFDGQERSGKNKYDDVADVWLKAMNFKHVKDFEKGSVLMYDFDNGLDENDAFGFFFENSDTGLGNEEVMASFGDSGGPTIVDGKITGVTSYILRLTTERDTSDVNGILDSSFGEFAGDTRVSKYAPFIYKVMRGLDLNHDIRFSWEELDDLDDIEVEIQIETEDDLDDIEVEIDEIEDTDAEEVEDTDEDLVSKGPITLTFETNESSYLMAGNALVTVDEGMNDFLELDGDEDFLMITNDTSTNYLTELSIIVRIQPDYSNGSPEFTIVSKENSFVLSLNNKVEPQKIVKFSIFDGIKWTTVESSSTINEEWTNIAATFNGESIMIYVNGELEGTQQVTGIPILSVNGKLKTVSVDGISSDSDIVIGAYLNTNRGETKIQNQFSGYIDDVLLFDTVIDQTQIYEIYHNATSNDVS